MKFAKLTIFLVFGIVIALLVSGCFNPNASEWGTESLREIDSRDNGLDADPFNVIIILRGPGAGRSVAGATASAIISGTNIRNTAQFIVRDSATKAIVGCAEGRKNPGDTETPLEIDDLSFGTYDFILLMGHGEKNYTEEPPTLLASGYKSNYEFTQDKLTENDDTGIITIDMRPIVVNTVFKKGNPETLRVHPTVGKKLSLTNIISPDPSKWWRVEWKVTGGYDGFFAPPNVADLFAAYNKVSAQGIEQPPQAEYEIIGIEDGYYFIERIIESYVSYNYKSEVYFNLKYAPWKNAGWTGISTEFIEKESGAPVWIIRNGFNDKVQDSYTDFTDLGNSLKNGNGAFSFKTLDIKNGDLDSGDEDNDNLLNYEEIEQGTDPNNWDTDGDGWSDGDEVHIYHTNPLDDNDYPISPSDPEARERDSDDDGLPDWIEDIIGTDKNNPDSDGDGYSDGLEVNIFHTDPKDGNDPKPPSDPEARARDTDGDGLPDWLEDIIGTNKDNPDTDGDGKNDKWEMDNGTDPWDPEDPSGEEELGRVGVIILW